MKVLSAAALLVFSVLTGACSTQSTTAVTSELPPADLVAYAPGSIWTWERGGKVETSEIISIDTNVLKFSLDSGCVYTRHAGMFGPEISFENCGGRSDEINILETNGQLWPLEVGKRQSWTYRSIKSSSEATQTRECAVEAQERVTVPAGQFDTYKIVCKSGNQNRTSYYAPSMKSTVLIDNHIIGLSRNRYELQAASILEL